MTGSGANVARGALLTPLLLLGPLVVVLDHGDPDRRTLAEFSLPLAALCSWSFA